jgi:hypothetical protein
MKTQETKSAITGLDARDKYLRLNNFFDVRVLCVAYYAYDFDVERRVLRERDSLADGIRWELKSLDEPFVDDGDPRLGCVLCVREVAAHDQRHADRLEILCADGVELGRRRHTWSLLETLDREIGVARPGVNERHQRRTDTAHAGQHLQLRLEPVEECPCLLGCVTVALRRYLERDQRLRAETEVGAPQICQALREPACEDKKRHR